jgi:hypothetical protein
MLALLDRAIRGGRIRLLKLDLEFKLFALRDQLRMDAIKEESPYNNWFEYMDTTLTRTIGRFGTINPWHAVGFMLTHRKDSDLFLAYEQMRKALRKPENRKIERIYDQYNESLNAFVKERYPASWPLAALTFMVLCPTEHLQHISIEQEERKLTPVFSISPETSTLREYSREPYGPQHQHSPIAGVTV